MPLAKKVFCVEYDIFCFPKNFKFLIVVLFIFFKKRVKNVYEPVSLTSNNSPRGGLFGWLIMDDNINLQIYLSLFLTCLGIYVINQKA